MRKVVSCMSKYILLIYLWIIDLLNFNEKEDKKNVETLRKKWRCYFLE
jgi:hypothetical protein